MELLLGGLQRSEWFAVLRGDRNGVGRRYASASPSSIIALQSGLFCIRIKTFCGYLDKLLAALLSRGYAGELHRWNVSAPATCIPCEWRVSIVLVHIWNAQLVCYREGPDSISGHFVWDLWWKKVKIKITFGQNFLLLLRFSITSVWAGIA
jgi:hypothetical protein